LQIGKYSKADTGNEQIFVFWSSYLGHELACRDWLLYGKEFDSMGIRYVPISTLQVCFIRMAALALTADVP